MNSISETTLFSLPTDVFCIISRMLSKRDILSISTTCKYFRDLFLSNEIWSQFIPTEDIQEEESCYQGFVRSWKHAILCLQRRNNEKPKIHYEDHNNQSIARVVSTMLPRAKSVVPSFIYNCPEFTKLASRCVRYYFLECPEKLDHYMLTLKIKGDVAVPTFDWKKLTRDEQRQLCFAALPIVFGSEKEREKEEETGVLNFPKQTHDFTDALSIPFSPESVICQIVSYNDFLFWDSKEEYISYLEKYDLPVPSQWRTETDIRIAKTALAYGRKQAWIRSADSDMLQNKEFFVEALRRFGGFGISREIWKLHRRDLEVLKILLEYVADNPRGKFTIPKEFKTNEELRQFALSLERPNLSYFIIKNNNHIYFSVLDNSWKSEDLALAIRKNPFNAEFVDSDIIVEEPGLLEFICSLPFVNKINRDMKVHIGFDYADPINIRKEICLIHRANPDVFITIVSSKDILGTTAMFKYFKNITPEVRYNPKVVKFVAENTQEKLFMKEILSITNKSFEYLKAYAALGKNVRSLIDPTKISFEKYLEFVACDKEWYLDIPQAYFFNKKSVTQKEIERAKVLLKIHCDSYKSFPLEMRAMREVALQAVKLNYRNFAKVPELLQDDKEMRDFVISMDKNYLRPVTVKPPKKKHYR